MLSLLGAASFVAAGALLYQVLNEQSIAIEPISVPKQLQDNGYTPDVAAARLRDALSKFAEDANAPSLELQLQSDAPRPALVLHGDAPQFVLPGIGLSFEAVATYVRTFFRITGRRNISGEITFVDNQIGLRLRKNGVVFYTSPEGVFRERPDELFAYAAPAVFDVTEPYLSAAARSHTHPADAIEMAKRIIADWPQSDHNVAWAHNLIGLILHRRHRLAEAISHYQSAIKLDHRIATAYNNWGLALREQGNVVAAIAKFRTAIEYEPHFAAAHKNLSYALRDSE